MHFISKLASEQKEVADYGDGRSWQGSHRVDEDAAWGRYYGESYNGTRK